MVEKLLRIEDDLQDPGFIETFAAEGIKELEAYLGKWAVFSELYPEKSEIFSANETLQTDKLAA